ncbi:MAG: RraA family protein [Oscillospiraceae bacterium]|jgi:regulator of RNase E activity RraA|nr:RraA family protein [Oscillospiraceae bacterium]
MKWTFSQREEILELYKNIRVADTRDGLDWIGYCRYGSMSSNMRPLERTRAIGFAKTARYIPFAGPNPDTMGDAYSEWSGWYYNSVCIYPWMNEIEKYDFPVIDMSNLPVGLMGSNNTMEGIRSGAVGYVAYGGVRDTDEVILQKIPFWSTKISQPMVQARLQYESHNTKINCDGVCVTPGDLVVADGDGVVVVPSDLVMEVAKWAAKEMTADRAARRKLYEDLGMPLDDTV